MTARAYDIVIIGAGMAGATLAALLADSGLRILLADAVAPDRFDPDVVALRVSALAPASARVLDTAGAWPGIRGQRVSPYRHMRIQDALSEAELTFDAAELALPELGWIVENALVQHALLQRLTRADAVDVACPMVLDGLEFDDTGATLRFGSRRVRGSLVVGADGAGSKVRGFAGIDTHAAPYGQQAVVAVVHTQAPHAETALQRFLPGGPVALLPLSDGSRSLVWSLPDADAETMLGMDDAAFGKALGEAAGLEITACGSRAAFPLSRLHAYDYVRPHCALIGDAAHVVHPLAGQGANLGLLDAAALAESLQDEVAAGASAGSWRALRRYARWRRAHNLVVQEALHGFHLLFRGRSEAVAALRGIGMRAVDAAGPVKRLLAEFATGERGDLPASARRAATFSRRRASRPSPHR